MYSSSSIIRRQEVIGKFLVLILQMLNKGFIHFAIVRYCFVSKFSGMAKQAKCWNELVFHLAQAVISMSIQQNPQFWPMR